MENMTAHNGAFPDVRWFEDFAVGQRFVYGAWTMLRDDMLVFAPGGHFPTRRFSLRALLDELRDQLAAELDSKKARLIISVDIPDVELHGNRQALLGVFANLCINGIQATNGPAVIRISSASWRY